jgi:co-chaperonin GroES (HSP10)
MDLKPLPGKVLVQPDPVETQTESGIVLVEHWPMECSGVVVAVGHSKHPRKEEAVDLAELLWRWCPLTDPPIKGYMADAAQLLYDLTGREPEVSVGDRVLFGLSAGQEITLNDTRYFLMNESDLLAVVPAGSEIAA